MTAAVFELEQESYTGVDPANPEQVILIDGSRIQGAEHLATRARAGLFNLSAFTKIEV